MESISIEVLFKFYNLKSLFLFTILKNEFFYECFCCIEKLFRCYLYDYKLSFLHIVFKQFESIFPSKCSLYKIAVDSFFPKSFLNVFYIVYFGVFVKCVENKKLILIKLFTINLLLQR